MSKQIEKGGKPPKKPRSKKQQKNPGGRKGIYHKWIKGDGLVKVRGWARDGLSDKDIAHNIGIAEGTIYEWKNKYPEFAEALAEEKEVADLKVVNALYQKCLGGIYESEKTIINEIEIDGQKQTETKKTITVKAVEPDITAIKFWTTNRMKDQWRDKIDQEITGRDGEPLTVQFNISRPPKKEEK